MKVGFHEQDKIVDRQGAGAGEVEEGWIWLTEENGREKMDKWKGKRMGKGLEFEQKME